MDAQILHQLGKVELHCHLDGSLSLPVIRRLAAQANVSLPADDAALQAKVCAPPDAQSLMDYLRPFDVIRPLLQTAPALRLAAHDVVAQAAAENVRYIEVRFAPEFSMDGELSALEAIEAVIAGLAAASAEFGVQANALVCGMRQSPAPVTQAIFAAAAPLVGRGVGGGDFAGNEAAFPPATVAASLQFAQSLGLPMTFHAGECHCAANIADALAAGVRRIGHATAIGQDPALIQRFVAAGAVAELCLTSNLQTKAANNLAEFPFKALRAAGAKITINTDNRTVSNTTLAREYELFGQLFGVTYADLLAFNQTAAAAAFIPPEQREALSRRLAAEYAPYVDRH
ncbi:adenosine deaminase [Lacticaseibacillus parakribbianus]|uniref:adenosine deaminase n=1 Tax=Lacticaseibacillus parakribbianus TaxID=2970927 RepID=UPI0021CB6BA8|nr:adenosine deaminase [Lacticaseibacillus parakribbianus]